MISHAIFVLSFMENHLLTLLTNHPKLNFMLQVTLCLTLMAFMLNLFMANPCRKVYLLDFACYKPANSLQCTKEMVLERYRQIGNFSEDSLNFIKKTLERSGMGESTYLPEGLMKFSPPNTCMEEARKEAEMVMFGAVDELLAKTGLKGKEIGMVVVNCTIFNPVPSLSSMIVNRYKLGENVLSYNLGGMGCSGGVRAISLAKHLLQVHHNSYALVLSTENITPNCYMGHDRSKILINCLFRIGGAAILLSNRPSDRRCSKYQLIHTVHTHTASSDRSYNCIFQEEDHEGHVGVTVNKDLLAVATMAINFNLAALGRLILPASEKLRFLANYIIRYFHVANIEPYVPNFKTAFDHFLPHPGGKPVLDEVERNLKISETQMEPSRMTLYRFGNVSSSTVWYELAYVEAKGRVKRGDRVWQIAFGSGFKCTSLIWKAMRTVDSGEKMNPWSDEIDEFPVVQPQSTGSFSFFFEPFKPT
ncbi:hypothetical protein PVL29_008325 [Vitis rotundifolia]|uniref:3-ketoacyl-CoA synthase n=1 Tax=Vitis rotundifolia TaxID=103349 RepID=A0AA39DVW4_VITRO|nr:hypothetical protein PVL29_008325 [Vitis rotundifolia]